MELKLNIFRGIAIFLTQLPLILFVGAKFDLIFGFNRMDSGFTLLLCLFVLVPLLNLSWIITEIILFIKLLRRHQVSALSILLPLIAVFFFIESIAIDLYILSHARM
jgi:hypothetical protein